MKKRKLTLAATFAALCTFGTAWTINQTGTEPAYEPSSNSFGTEADQEENDNQKEDVTAKYLVNSSFEDDKESELTEVTNSSDGLRGWTLTQPAGWDVSGADVTKLLISKDCFTDNNFGKVTSIPDGQYAYYLRMGWNSGSTTLSQDVKSLPAGKYLLTVDQRSGFANSASSKFTINIGEANITESFMQGSSNMFVNQEWTTNELYFDTDTDGDIKLTIKIDWLSGGSCLMIDNVKLYKLSDDYVKPSDPTEDDVTSFTEGIINNDFVDETTMKNDLLQMLADFSEYMKNDFQNCEAPNSIGEACGCFKGENTMGNDERGVRPNADMSMLCAFLSKYAKGKVTLPENVTWDDIETLAMKSLVFAYSTHKANKLKVCSGNNYWGSVSNSDHVWESSLWAMSVAYSAYFQWDKLSEAQKGYIKALLKAECNYELERDIPTGYAGDTKAEENGWEADVLAAALGLFPDDEMAPRWFERLREFAINSYSHVNDANDNTVIDPEYNNKTVADLYKGKNLYDDYTLQNHNLFHTSYQNVVMQELGEAALALKIFQLGTAGEEKWKTNALMHNHQEVMDSVLNWLALADGELAMPNGNDWSLFLYDQITSYTTMACFLKDPNALMLENMAYKYIKARQKTTEDGSWLLNPDVGARRMGVEGHRVMMTWLMHEVLSTENLTPTKWDDFNKQYSDAKLFTSQNIVRASSEDRFTCFSWSTGLSSYTGYIASNSPDKNKIIVPYRANNTGNFLGWYTVDGKATNASPVVSGIYDLKGNSYTMNGEINTNDASLNNRFTIYSTPGNAVIYIDYVRGLSNGTINSEQGGLMAISTDPLMKEKRTLYYEGEYKQLDGKTFTTMKSDWVNIDNELGIIGHNNKSVAFGDRGLNNSIYTSKIYPAYSNVNRSFKNGDVVDRRNIVYYSRIDAEKTQAMSKKLNVLTDSVPEGWNGVIAADPDGTEYLLLSNFVSEQRCTLKNISCELGAPVFTSFTTVSEGKSTATFSAETNRSISNVLKVFVNGSDIKAVQAEGDSCAAYLQNTSSEKINPSVSIISDGNVVSGTAEINAGSCVKVSVKGGKLLVEAAEMPSENKVDYYEGYIDITDDVLRNASFEDDKTYGDIGSITLGSTTYDPCYINKVATPDSKWSNVLRVSDWKSESKLETASNYARMYSMPYSSTMYCVSPSSVGNYAAQSMRPVEDDSCGTRCLTVLNSWTAGDNRITQTVNMPKGKYRLLLDMKYDCPNQTSNNGSVIETPSNTNTSLTGVAYDGNQDFRYPQEKSTWEVMCYDFELSEPTDVTFSLGFSTSSGTGAANNTLLYIDNLRLLSTEKYIPTGIEYVETDKTNENTDVYSLSGQLIKHGVKKQEATANLPHGIYIVGNEKVIVR